MPVATCNRCGRPKPCPRHPRRRQSAERRSYSDTATARAVRDEVLERYGHDCHYCHRPIPDPELGPLELAHLIAHADGGAFDADNVRPAHRYCNRAAGRRQS